MAIIDKRDILSRIRSLDNVILDLGCGNRKLVPDSIGVDLIDYDCVDIIGDIYDVLEKVPDSSIRAVYSNHFIEHVRDIELLVREITRVLKVGGSLDVVAPHFSNPYYFSDYTHKCFFGLYTFSYLSVDRILKRRVPKYKITCQLELCEVYLGFKSSPPFYGRHCFKFFLGKVFNFNNYLKEFYEENLCFIFPCYEVKYSLRKIGRAVNAD